MFRRTFYPNLFAQLFVLRNGAVNISDYDGLGICEVVSELIPRRFHGLTVASPRRLELNESILSFDRLKKVFVGQSSRAAGVHAEGCSAEQDGDERRRANSHRRQLPRQAVGAKCQLSL